MARETHRRRGRALAVALFAIALAGMLAIGCLGSQRLFTGPAPPTEKLSIALPRVPHAALLYVAVAKGYLAEEGLDLAITPVGYGRAALELLTQGKVDLAAATEVPFATSVLKGERLGIVAAVASVSSETAVVARRDRAIAAPHDLLGKRIGVTFGTSGEFSFWSFLIRNRLAPGSVTLVDLQPGTMVQELAKGTIDAISTWEPFKSNAHSALGDNAVSFTDADAFTVDFLVIGRSELLKARSGALEKLVRALLKAERFNQSEPQQALRLVAEQLKLDIKALEPSWKDFEFKVDLSQSLLVTLEDEARWAMARGYADKGPLPNFLPHLHLDTLLAVQPARVTVVR